MKPSIWFPLLATAWLGIGLYARFILPHSVQMSLSLAMMWVFSLLLTGIATFVGAMVCYNSYSASETAQARLWVWMVCAALHLLLAAAVLVRAAAL
jgi:hypothetical protein